MDYKPKDVPDLRSWLVRSWDGPHHYTFDVWWSMRGIREDPTPPDVRVERQMRRLATADLYWISPEMCDLIIEAARTIPPETCISPEMVPSPNMLVVYGKPLTAPAVFGVADGPSWAETTDVVVSHWVTGPYRSSGDGELYEGVMEEGYCTRESVPADYGCPQVHLVGGGALPFDQPLSHHIGTTENAARLSSSEYARKMMVATMALLASPGIAEERAEPPPRSVARRCQRAGVEPSDVRVIYLRSTGGGEHGDGQSNYHHRWIVSGHWRSQPYGPGRARRKPVWIAPHVKGPEGAPLLHGDKVRAVVR